MEIKAYKANGLAKVFLVLGVLGGLGTLASFFANRQQFAFSYLVPIMFFTAIALGGFWFVLIQHLTRAGWSVVVRRLAENVAANLQWMGLFILPLVVFCLHDLFHWTHPEAAQDPILAAKAGYLNMPFFLTRTVAFFAIWFFFTRYFLKQSVAQDLDGSHDRSRAMQKTATFGTVLYVLTETFFAFDWLMSLQPHWFSTMFGVYYFACSAVGIYTTIVLMVMTIRKSGHLEGVITVEHDHDLGKLLFGFNVFWTYIAFAQFMLIWYANLGEETPFFMIRSEGSWKTLSIMLPFIHFAIPFLFMISREIKRNRIGLTIAAVWLFVVNYIDIYWLVMPNFHKGGVRYGWEDLSALLFVGGFFFYLITKRLEKSALIPIRDPRLHESLNHHT